MPLTEISGIGAKTAEKLRRSGIQSKDELLRRFERGDPEIVGGQGKKGLNKRAIAGIRNELFEQERTFDDPVMGLSVGPDNRKAAQTLGTKTLSDFSSIDTRDSDFDADTTLGELAGPASEGKLGEMGTDATITGFAADAAANLGVSDLDSGQIQDVNRINARSGGFTTTGPGEVSLGDDRLPEGATEKFDLDAKEVARAESFHQKRSAKAQRVDERNNAPITDKISKWRKAPSRFDYPGVDTPESLTDFFADKRKRKRGGFGSFTTENRDKSGLKTELEQIDAVDSDVQERALGEPVDFSIDKLFPES